MNGVHTEIVLTHRLRFNINKHGHRGLFWKASKMKMASPFANDKAVTHEEERILIIQAKLLVILL